jgi:hypothetical protein
MDPRLAVSAVQEGVAQADDDITLLRDFWV